MQYSHSIAAFNNIFLKAFQTTLCEIKRNCIQNCLKIEGDQLIVAGRSYFLNKNVHFVAFGKAALGMVDSAEQVLAQHFVDGIASVQSGENILKHLRTKFFLGASNNLPDEQAMENTKYIQQFVQRIKGPDQLVLFLISGGGSALLPAPIPGITLADKLTLIRLLQENGANIVQLNTVRRALSRLKGGGLARLASPSKQLALIISDIVGDPLEFIAGGPTVIPLKKSCDPLKIMVDELGISRDKIGEKILNALERRQREEEEEEKQKVDDVVDVQNVIVASNSSLLKELAAQLNSAGFTPLIITNRLEGNATDLGRSLARLSVKLAELGANLDVSQISNCIEGEKELSEFVDVSEISKSSFQRNDKIVLIFGGETTVRFDTENKAGKNWEAKGGRNQELVLAAFLELLTMHINRKLVPVLGESQFALFSLGSDGQDGPTDAAGAYLSKSDFVDKSLEQLTTIKSILETSLAQKRSYHFWTEFDGGKNLVKTGKTGMNLMDVQMIAIKL